MKTWLITGCSTGLGRSLAKKALAKGYNVAITVRNKDKIIDLSKQYPQTALALCLDVTNKESIQAAIKETIEHFGTIDVLVNNAGITKDGLLMRMKENDFDAVINVNLKGTWNCMKHATKIMMKQRYGRIISMSSVVGVMGNAGQVNYSASKAGIIGMTMSLAREVGSRGITVNAIAPGFIKTAMTDVLPDDIKDSMAKQIPLGVFGEVSDIANTVVFLASDDAKYITGQTIHVDGGMAM